MAYYLIISRIGLMRFFIVKEYFATQDCVKEYFIIYDFVKEYSTTIWMDMDENILMMCEKYASKYSFCSCS